MLVGLLAPTQRAPALAEPASPRLQATLRALERAVVEGRPGAAAALAAPGDHATSALLADLVTNARAAGLTEVSFTAGAVGAVPAGGSWSQPVVTTWRISGFDPAPAQAPVTFRFRSLADQVAVAGVGGAPGPTPLWMSGPLRVRRAGGSMVLVQAGAGDPGTYLEEARRAARAVSSALPRRRSRLVVEVPATVAHLEAALAAPRGEYAAVAAVTATADASGSWTAPAHVLVNPRRFRTLTTRGVRVVLTHEAAHVALGAATSTMPLWLAEGFADHVALRGLPAARDAVRHRLRAWVRRAGPPAQLPGPAEFAASGDRLERAYETAWAACDVLVARAGEHEALRFYRAVAAGAGPSQELRSRFGLTHRSFLRLWWDRLSGSES